ncbi:MAG: hypothetical protein ACK5IC_11540 [Moheibacter sp.]
MNGNNFELKPLSPYSHMFKGRNNMENRIDYYYLNKLPSNDVQFYQQLKDSVFLLAEKRYDFNLYSIYIYKETDELNEKFNKQKLWLDGHNKDLIAYIRFNNGENDIFYIIQNEIVIFDNVKNEKVYFEFEQ